jgi:hypothetical protein
MCEFTVNELYKAIALLVPESLYFHQEAGSPNRSFYVFHWHFEHICGRLQIGSRPLKHPFSAQSKYYVTYSLDGFPFVAWLPITNIFHFLFNNVVWRICLLRNVIQYMYGMTTRHSPTGFHGL